MTLMGDAISAVRVRLDEISATAWTDPEIRGWINEACAEIARRTESMPTDANIAVPADTQGTPLPPDVLRVSRVEWWDDDAGTTIRPLEIREKFAMDAIWSGSQRTARGTPAYVTFTGFPPALNAQVYPINASDGFLQVTYYAAATALAINGDDDAVQLAIPTGWDDLILDYATQCAQRRDGLPAWQDTRQIFEAKLQQMWDMVQFYHNQGGQITDDPNGWDTGYYGW